MLVEGYSLVQICSAQVMPNRGTVIDWMNKRPDFADRVRAARAEQADLMDDLILAETQNATPETFQVAKVRIAAYQWRASKLAPKKYGDRTDVNLSGSISIPEEQLDARISELLRKAGTVPALEGPRTIEAEE